MTALWTAVRDRYDLRELYLRPPSFDVLPTVPPPRHPELVHDCGHAHTSYATSPRTFRTRCLPCHQQAMLRR